MKTKQKRLQLIFVSLGLILFIGTYLYYPNLNKKNLTQQQSEEKSLEKVGNKNQITALENIEYKGLYDFDKPFKVKSKEAYILNEEPDVVYMTNMHVILSLGNNRTVEITSLKGRYNKANYNCFFEKDVLATDGDTKITAENLDLLASENFIEIYNDVFLDYTIGSLKADKIDYNFETKHFKVSMFDDESVKMKVIR